MTRKSEGCRTRLISAFGPEIDEVHLGVGEPHPAHPHRTSVQRVNTAGSPLKMPSRQVSFFDWDTEEAVPS